MPNQILIEEYVAMLPLTVDAFAMDVSNVHTLIGNLVMGSYTTYAKI